MYAGFYASFYSTFQLRAFTKPECLSGCELARVDMADFVLARGMFTMQVGEGGGRGSGR